MDKWTPDFWSANENECKNHLMEPRNWEKVPLLFNHEPAPQTLVRFKGMIQDMLSPEYYNKNMSFMNSEHRPHINESEEEVSADTNDLAERQVLVCIPIPGLNEWAKNVAITDDENEMQLEPSSNKRVRLETAYEKYSKEVFIYIYTEEEDSKFKVNSIIDVVGFLDHRSNQVDNEGQPSGTIKEYYCIHTVQFKVLTNLMQNNEDEIDCIWKEASNLHAELKLILTQALLGDSLAADYLLFHLISTIYNRQYDRVPGKCSLNIRGIPESIGKTYIKKLYSLISYLVVKSEYLPITIDTMNNMDMIPKKCYDSNRLSQGFLQLSSRTHLIIDETNLQPGKLETKGMQNLQALQNVISNQKIQYDFTYYMIDYETEIPALTLSIGKSLLPNDVEVLLCPDPSCLNSVDEIINSAYQYLISQELLTEKLRKYIGTISTFNFNFNRDILEAIENDYVHMRRADPKSVSPDDLHRYLMISKLIALCSGKNELNKEIWEQCKTMENSRKSRNLERK